MVRNPYCFGGAASLMLGGLTFAWADEQAVENASHPPRLISESAILAGLEGQTLFPFIDTTPNRIRRAHIAITDKATDCAPGVAAPSNIQILVGEAGVSLFPVMNASTNTGISNRPDQCVFHITVRPGVNGVPSKVTDIVVLNLGESNLTGLNTITVSAEVQ